MIIHASSQDSLWDVIEARDYNSQFIGLGRTRTRDTPGDALAAPWDAAQNAAVGPGSLNKFVMVRRMDIQSHPQYGKPNTPGGLSPKSYVVDPKTLHGKYIPEYPHKCLICGGGLLILFSSWEHEGGVCPGPPKKEKEHYRGRLSP